MNVEKKKVYPVPGRRVRMLNGQLLPKEGATVPWNIRWEKKLRHGDVTLTAPEQPAPAPKEAPPATGDAATAPAAAKSTTKSAQE